MLTIEKSAAKLRTILHEIGNSLVERETLIQLIVLAAIAHEHLLVLGPPGTAKSAAVRAVAKAFDGRYFEYALGRFSEPNELFGPIDLRKLREGTVETETRGMLPEADIAFLDEVFLGSTAILNTLLTLLNERQFRRGHTSMKCPLRVCVAASNTLPDDPTLSAFADRFLVRLHIDSLPDSCLENLLKTGWHNNSASSALPPMKLEELDELSTLAARCDVSPVRDQLAQCIRQLRKTGIHLSDRRIVKTQSLIAASAALNGRDQATTADLWPLIYVIPTPEAQQQARETLHSLLSNSANEVLPHAVSHAAAGALARSGLITTAAEQLLREKPDIIEQDDAWSLRAESLLREIDAGFTEHSLPETLASLRKKLAAAIIDIPSENAAAIA